MDQTTRRMYLLVAWVSFAMVVGVALYGLLESVDGGGQPIGEVLVNVYWPIAPYFAQPITYFGVASVALFYAGLRLWEERLARWPHWILMLLQVFALVVAFSAAYEVIYNFVLWGASYSVACAKAIANQVPCSPDNLSTLYPTPWSLVFATRAFATLFVVSGYSTYFLRRFAGSRSI